MWKMADQAEGCVRQGVRMQRQGQEVHLPERLQALASGFRFGMEPIYIIYIVGCQLFHPAREGRPFVGQEGGTGLLQASDYLLYAIHPEVHLLPGRGMCDGMFALPVVIGRHIVATHRMHVQTEERSEEFILMQESLCKAQRAEHAPAEKVTAGRCPEVVMKHIMWSAHQGLRKFFSLLVIAHLLHLSICLPT